MSDNSENRVVPFESAVKRFWKYWLNMSSDIALNFSNLTDKLQSIISTLWFKETSSILELRSDVIQMLKGPKKNLESLKPKLLDLLKMYLLTTEISWKIIDKSNDPAISINPKWYLDLDFFVSKSAHNWDQNEKNKISRINIWALIILLLIYLEAGFKKWYNAIMSKLLTRTKSIDFFELLEIIELGKVKEQWSTEIIKQSDSPFEKLAVELWFIETNELRAIRLNAISILKSDNKSVDDNSSEFWKYMNEYLNKWEQLFSNITDNEISDKLRFWFTLMQAMIFFDWWALKHYDLNIEWLLDELYDIWYEELWDRVIELDKNTRA